MPSRRAPSNTRARRRRLLLFLPGAGEIRRTQARLLEADLGGGVDVLPCTASSRQPSRTALAPARAGRRKCVLATNIAETGLTIDGVRIVVTWDSSGATCSIRERHEPARDAAHLARPPSSARAARVGPPRRVLSSGARARSARSAYAPPRSERRPHAARARPRRLGHGRRSPGWLDAPPPRPRERARSARRLGALDTIA